jgi:hypothetical protein
MKPRDEVAVLAEARRLLDVTPEAEPTDEEIDEAAVTLHVIGQRATIRNVAREFWRRGFDAGKGAK